MRNKKVGRIKVKIDGERMASKLWGAWSIRRAAVCIALLIMRMAEELGDTTGHLLSLIVEAIHEERTGRDCDGKEGEET